MGPEFPTNDRSEGILGAHLRQIPHGATQHEAHQSHSPEGRLAKWQALPPPEFFGRGDRVQFACLADLVCQLSNGSEELQSPNGDCIRNLHGCIRRIDSNNNTFMFLYPSSHLPDLTHDVQSLAAGSINLSHDG
jgi:hypothetical protein